MSRKPLVVIVDDDSSIRHTTRDLLRSAGLNAAAFACAEDFLAQARLQSVGCVIADMRMPGMSGLRLHEHLAASGLHIPVILITAYPEELVRARAMEAGVLGFFAKPFIDHELLDCIGVALSTV